MSDYVSSIKQIPYPQERVYAKLSDLNNLQEVKDRMNEPGAAEKVEQMAAASGQSFVAEQVTQLREKLDSLTFDRDTVTMAGTALGDMSLHIVEREEPKTIKLEGVHTPVPATLWIQLLPVDGASCKMRVTLRAELNFFIRQMAGKHLQEGVEKMADLLAGLPY